MGIQIFSHTEIAKHKLYLDKFYRWSLVLYQGPDSHIGNFLESCYMSLQHRGYSPDIHWYLKTGNIIKQIQQYFK